jgi:hypothetical protein
VIALFSATYLFWGNTMACEKVWWDVAGEPPAGWIKLDEGRYYLVCTDDEDPDIDGDKGGGGNDDPGNSTNGVIEISLHPGSILYEGQYVSLRIKLSSPLTEDVDLKIASIPQEFASDLQMLNTVRLPKGSSGTIDFEKAVFAKIDTTTEFVEKLGLTFSALGASSGGLYGNGNLSIEIKDQLLALTSRSLPTAVPVDQAQAGITVFEETLNFAEVISHFLKAGDFKFLSGALAKVAASFNATIDFGNIENTRHDAVQLAQSIPDPSARAQAEYVANQVAFVQQVDLFIKTAISVGSPFALGAAATALGATGAGVVVAPILLKYASGPTAVFVYDEIAKDSVTVIMGKFFESLFPPPGQDYEPSARIEFSDGTVAYDIEGNAGQAYRLYQAAFDRDPDFAGLGNWIRHLDQGNGDLNWVSNHFINSKEFTDTYGTPASVSNADFIALLYENVLDRQPDEGGYASWNANMNNGMSRAEVLAYFAESPENKANVAPEITDGMWFV